MRVSAASSEPAHEPAGQGFSQFLHSWRYFLWLLSGILVVTLFFAEENWRGQWAWSRYKQQKAARGERLEISASLPPRVPDDQNFAMTPFLEPLFDFIPGTQKWPGKNPVDSINRFATNYDAASREMNAKKAARFNSWVKARTDLPAWYAAFLNSTNKPGKQDTGVRATRFAVPEAAAGILVGVSEADPVFEELRIAAKLPCCRFNLHYEEQDPAGILLPHLAVLKHLCQVLELRACAELALNQTDQASQDVKLMLYLTDACRNEPFVVSQLVRMAMLTLALQPIAEGIQQWSDADLQALQESCAHFDFCADTRRVLSAERVWSSAIIDYVRRSPDKLNLLAGFSGARQPGFGLGAALMGVAPNGWFDFEQLNCCVMVDECVLPVIEQTNRLISPRLTRLANQRIAALTGHSLAGLYFRHLFFSKLLLPSIARTAQKAALAQAGADCAVIACALERYRRKHGQFPESLGALEPQFVEKLPHDVINGEPLKYCRPSNGEYILYSVGWNETDDGGVTIEAESGEDNPLAHGDWVWRLP